jgi:competence ComEA-like helix-hairpin-helix protein
MFNRREQLALLFLGASLLIGAALAAVDYWHSSTLEDFRVVPLAVPVPQAAVLPSAEEGPIRLNQATAEQLERLPSIGAKTAARILAHRQEYGPFKSLEELRQVQGIGAQTLEKVRPLLVIE